MSYSLLLPDAAWIVETLDHSQSFSVLLPLYQTARGHTPIETPWRNIFRELRTKNQEEFLSEASSVE